VVELEFVMRIVVCIEQGDAEWAETYGWVSALIERRGGKEGGRRKERVKEKGEIGIPPIT